jgi:arylsulfatase A-like enzyme
MKTLVIVASGLHLGYIGCYGNEWVQTPALDRLAGEGIVFDHHYADQPVATGALHAWQTGCYRFPSMKPEDELASKTAPNLFSILREQRIETCLVSDDRDRLLFSETAGWRHLHLLESAAEEGGLPERLGGALVEALIHPAPHKHGLLRLDLGVLLPPWNTPGEFHDRYPAAGQSEDEEEPQIPSADSATCELQGDQDLAFLELQNHYAAAVTYLDSSIARILLQFEERGLLDDMLVLVTSDHGQNLGEDAMRPGSRLSLHEELIHIPLILRLPGKAEAGRRVNLLTQPVDLLPTLFDAFGVSLPAVHGQSLLPLAKGERKGTRSYACAGLRAGDRIEWALRTPDWLFLRPVTRSPGSTSESELYVKPDDRWEVNNVRQHHLELAERLEETLGCFIEATRHPGPLRPPELPNLERELANDQEAHAPDLTARSMPP